ncbi:MAG: right-handed parallel beta-helix repeat-containing protein, partial [Pirellulales bacterium]
PTSLAGSFTGINDLTSKGAVLISGNITTTGNQSYDAGVTLDGTTELTGNSLSLNNGVNGNNNSLYLIFNTTTAINSNFTNITQFDTLGPVSLTGNFSTEEQYYYAPVTLLGDTVLSVSGVMADPLHFFDTLDGSHDLSVDAGGVNVRFDKAVGSTAPLRSLNLASAASVEALESLTIDGTGGTGPGLRLGPAVGNVNISQPGSTISNAAQEGILLAGGSANTELAGFTISNSGASGVVALAGNYSGTTFSNSTVTGSAGSGFASNNAEGFTVSNSEFSTNADHGIRFDAAKNSAVRENVIGNNGKYGVLVVTSDSVQATSNISVDSNFIGTNSSDESTPNGKSGIWVLGQTHGHGTVDDVSITGNTIENNLVHGIEVWSATNVTIGGVREDGVTENKISKNANFGIALTDAVNGAKVLGNTLTKNTEAGLWLNSAKGATVGHFGSKRAPHIEESDFGIVATGDLTNTSITGSMIQDNVYAGVQLVNAKHLSLFRNTIQDNGPYGVLALGESTQSQIHGNTIQRQEAGVWLAGASGLTVGSFSGVGNEAHVGNFIKDNSWVGIVVQGSTAVDNVILSNHIESNIYFGIEFVQGAPSIAVPRLISATTDQIVGRIQGEEGQKYLVQFFYTSATESADGRYAQGENLLGSQEVTIGSDGTATIELDVSSSEMVAGDIITATATSLVDSNGVDVPSLSSGFSQGRIAREASSNTP